MGSRETPLEDTQRHESCLWRMESWVTSVWKALLIHLMTHAVTLFRAGKFTQHISCKGQKSSFVFQLYCCIIDKLNLWIHSVWCDDLIHVSIVKWSPPSSQLTYPSPHSCVCVCVCWEHLRSTLLANFSVINYGHPLHIKAPDITSSYKNLVLINNWKLVPFDQRSISPNSSPWKSPFYSLFLGIHFFFFSFHIYDSMQYSSFSIWPFSFSIILPRFMQVIANGTTSFFFVAEY